MTHIFTHRTQYRLLCYRMTLYCAGALSRSVTQCRPITRAVTQCRPITRAGCASLPAPPCCASPPTSAPPRAAPRSVAPSVGLLAPGSHWSTRLNHNTIVYQYRSCTQCHSIAPAHYTDWSTRVNHNTIVYQYRSCTQCRCIVPAHYTHSVIQCLDQSEGRPGLRGALPSVSLGILHGTYAVGGCSGAVVGL